MTSVDSSGVRIAFSEQGTGSGLILAHSFLCSGEMWHPQVDELASSRRVINVDLRGHGRSGPTRTPFDLYDMVADLVTVLDHLGVERAVWGGLSIGGMIALRAALTVPERVSGLVLLDTHAGSETFFKRIKYRLMGAGSRLLGIRLFLPPILRLMFGRTTLRANRALVEQWREKIAAVDLPSILCALEALVRRDSVTDRLAEIRVPTLVVVGEEDRSLPVPYSREIASRIPGARLVVIPHAGHLSCLEQPQPVTAVIRKFLDEIPS